MTHESTHVWFEGNFKKVSVERSHRGGLLRGHLPLHTEIQYIGQYSLGQVFLSLHAQLRLYSCRSLFYCTRVVTSPNVVRRFCVEL